MSDKPKPPLSEHFLEMYDTEEQIKLERIVMQKVMQEEAAKERRRYALLQAATTLHASFGAIEDNGCTIEDAVDCAEGLLGEIERREKEGIA